MNRWLGLSFASRVVLWVITAGAQAAETAGVQTGESTADETRGLQVAETARLSSYSALEQSVVNQQLSERGLAVDPNPEGKQVEDIQIVTLDVFDERDPMPDFVDVLHTTTRKRVIRRELLIEKGLPYRSLLAQETARNLRSLIQLSIVLVVPSPTCWRFD